MSDQTDKIIKAKFVCASSLKTKGCEAVKMEAVSESNPENATFSKWTPHATLDISITNPAAFGFFQPGEEYYLDFRQATPETETP